MTVLIVFLAIVAFLAVVALRVWRIENRRWDRRGHIAQARDARLMEDVYWNALRHIEYRRAMVITLRRESFRMEQMIADGLERRVGVVA